MTVFAVGIELDGEGTHPAAWRRSSHRPDQLLTGKAVRDRVAAAENAGFTFATFDDSILPPSGDVVGRIDAVSRASYVAATTSTIGWSPSSGPRTPNRFIRPRNWRRWTTPRVGVAAGLLFRSKTMPRRGRGGGLR